MNHIKSFIRFSRPHTVIGTSLSVIALYVIAADGLLLEWVNLQILGMALFSCLAANIYIVGLNQLTDVEIDRINKPDLPLASGDYSIRTGKHMVITSLILALVSAAFQSIYLISTVYLSLLIGTMYSLKPFRLKRFHFWAAFSIFSVRGLIVNLLLFLHFSYSINGFATIPEKIWVLTVLMFGLSLVIAWFKDLPDMEGDRRFAIGTLTLQLGAAPVFGIGNLLLSFVFMGVILATIIGISAVNNLFLGGIHVVLLILLWIKSRPVVLEKRDSTRIHYMFIWKLFFAEYIIFAFVSLTAIG
jgi:homogentisate phytyltransferase/homogentisate geranylgeranyltransferase